MKVNLRAVVGLISIVLILVSGWVMGQYLLETERASVTQDEWQRVTARLDALESDSSLAVATDNSVDTSVDQVVLVNQADQNLLEELPGIGPARATDILEARSAGPFRDLDDFRARVTSIPASVFDDISTKISFE